MRLDNRLPAAFLLAAPAVKLPPHMDVRYLPAALPPLAAALLAACVVAAASMACSYSSPEARLQRAYASFWENPIDEFAGMEDQIYAKTSPGGI
jgi:hypothetical protein